MSQKTKIALIDPIGNHGGMNFYDDGLCLGLENAGVETLLFSNYVSKFSRRSYPYFAKQWKAKNNLEKVCRFYMALFRALLKAKKEKVDAVHLYSFRANARLYSAIWLAKKMVGRVVLTNHDVSSFLSDDNDSLERRIHDASDAIIVHNAFSRKELLAKMGHLAPKVHTIPHGNYLPFKPQGMNGAAARGKADGFSLLFFGQIKEVKGLDILLEAFAEFAKDKDGVSLKVAGKVWKDDFSKYQTIIDRNGIADKVDLDIRYIKEEEIPDLYGAADYIVLPYRRIYQSGVLLHSMSFGCPVIVSDLEPFTEVVKNGAHGYVFQSENPANLAEIMDLAYKERHSIREKSELCIKEMVEHFSWEKIGASLADVYLP